MSQKILVLEDERSLNRAINTYFSGLGYDVSSAFNTSDITHSIEQFCPDLIIVDLWIEPMAGDVVTKHIKSNLDNCCPVILISAKDNLDRTAKNAKADAYLKKPFTLPELEDMAKKFIKQN
jgi:two-component system response regulator AtoC